MKKKMITTLELDGQRIETKNDLKECLSKAFSGSEKRSETEDWDVNGFIERRAKITNWLKENCPRKNKMLSSIESDEEWIKELADFLGCQEKYQAYLNLKAQSLSDEEKRNLVALIRSDKLSDDKWVDLVRQIKYEDVEGYMSEEEFNEIQEAVKKN